MKTRDILLAAAAAMALTSCAKNISTGQNYSAQRQFEAWIQTNGYSDARKTELGSYIIEETTGDISSPIGKSDNGVFVLADFTARDLYSGKITSTTSRELAVQIGDLRNGDLDTTFFYGPKVKRVSVNYEYAGVEELICGMNVGGHAKAFIPGWLMTKKRYANAEKYLSSGSGDPTFYDITILKKIDDIKKWEVDSIVSYLGRNFPATDPADTVNSNTNSYGMYYISTGKPTSDRTFPNDTTVYVNYIGRLLNGQVFDTNIENLAKDAGLWSSSRTYQPVAVKMNEEESSITMDGSKVITGFSRPISKMHPYEKGTAVFYSAYGYSYSGSGGRIPPYSPLRFDFEIVDKP